jgi:predicted Zn-dependent peptidase
MLDRPPGGEGLGLARNALTLSLPRQFETVSQVTRKVATRIVYDLPDDYWKVYRNRIEAVERDEVVELVRRRLEPGGMVMVVAAAAADVVPDLERRFERVDVLPDTA